MVTAVTPTTTQAQLQAIIDAENARLAALGTTTNPIDTSGSAATGSKSGVTTFLDTYTAPTPYVAPTYTAPTVYQPLATQPDIYGAGKTALDTAFRESAPRTAIAGMPGQFNYTTAAKLRPATGAGYTFTPPSVTSRPRSLLSPKDVQAYGGLGASKSQQFSQNRATIDRTLRAVLGTTPALQNTSNYNMLRNRIMSGEFGDAQVAFDPATAEGQRLLALVNSLSPTAAAAPGSQNITGGSAGAGTGSTAADDYAALVEPLGYGGYRFFNRGGPVKKSEGSAQEELARLADGGNASSPMSNAELLAQIDRIPAATPDQDPVSSESSKEKPKGFVSWLLRTLNNTVGLPTNARVYVESVLEGRTDPITNEAFSPREIAVIKDLIAASTTDYLDPYYKWVVEATPGVVDYGTYSKEIPSAATIGGVRWSNSPSAGIASALLPEGRVLTTLGQFGYELTPEGDVRVKDQYNFNSHTAQGRPTIGTQYMEMNPLEKTLFGVASLGYMPLRSMGQEYIPEGGRPVDVVIPKNDFSTEQYESIRKAIQPVEPIKKAQGGYVTRKQDGGPVSRPMSNAELLAQIDRSMANSPAPAYGTASSAPDREVTESQNMLQRFTSLNTPQDMSIPEIAADIALGFAPVVGTAQGLRDFERARRDDDTLGMVLGAASAVPIVGGVVKAARTVGKAAKAADDLAALTAKAPLDMPQAVRMQTEYELAHEVAQRNAALPVEQGGLGLPPNNTAMDRAKAMGFDTTAYHGTKGDIKKYDNSRLGSTTNAESAKQAHFFASNPETAGHYAINESIPREFDRANLLHDKYIKMKTLSDELGDAGNDVEADIAFSKAKELLKQYREEHDSVLDYMQKNNGGKSLLPSQYISGANIQPLMLRTGNSVVYDQLGDRANTGGFKGFSDMLKSASNRNADSVIIKNTLDPSPTDVYAIFDPANIRSRFAAFDPAKRGSGNLSYAQGGYITKKTKSA